MAEIKACGEWIVFTCGNQFAVIRECDPSSWQVFKVPEPVSGTGDSCPKEDTGPNRILASAFSRDGRHFAICDDRKQLHVYCTTPSWSLFASRPLVRRCSCVRFLWGGGAVLVGDKSGDIYRFPLGQDGLGPGRLLLGHLSMLLDMTMTQNDEKIVTADRDEKVRISHYPNAYNISQYCMGHTQFVKCLEYAEDIDVIFSGSGDGCVRCWRSQGGARSLACRQCGVEGGPPRGDEGGEEAPERLAVQQLAYLPDQRLLLAAVHGLPTVEVLRVEGDGGSGGLSLEPQQSLTCPGPPSLALLQPPQGAPLLLLALHPRGSSLTLYRLQDRQFHEIPDEDSDLAKLRAFVGAQEDFFQEAESCPSEMDSLWKVPVDTRPQYLQEKARKMEQKRQRSPASSQRRGGGGQGRRKKAKN